MSFRVVPKSVTSNDLERRNGPHVHAGKLTDILFCHSLRQHVTSPTNVHGHTLDLLITRDDHSVAVLPVDPPLLSDNAFVVADCSCPLLSSATSTTFRRMRSWCALDVDAFDVDLQQSVLYRTPPADPKTAFSHYDQTPSPNSGQACTNRHQAWLLKTVDCVVQ